MPKYAALIYRVEADPPKQNSPESRQLYQLWGAFNQDVATSGVMTSGTGLQPTATATIVRVRNGKTLITDGPFAETREQLGDVLIFECNDLDEAIQWASRVPIATFSALRSTASTAGRLPSFALSAPGCCSSLVEDRRQIRPTSRLQRPSIRRP
jgi:hypothetical protein